MIKNEEIKQIFNNFVVNGIEIPVKFLKYKGNADIYITYTEIDNSPAFCSDNECDYSVVQYDFDIYTKTNYKDILQAVKQKLLENGWTWTGDSPDMYEEDTGLFHKTTTFEKEN